MLSTLQGSVCLALIVTRIDLDIRLSAFLEAAVTNSRFPSLRVLFVPFQSTLILMVPSMGTSWYLQVCLMASQSKFLPPNIFTCFVGLFAGFGFALISKSLCFEAVRFLEAVVSARSMKYRLHCT